MATAVATKLPGSDVRVDNNPWYAYYTADIMRRRLLRVPAAMPETAAQCLQCRLLWRMLP